MAGPLSSPEPWNLVASAYNEIILPVLEGFTRQAMNLLALPEEPSRVLDVACGPGTGAALLAQAGHQVDAVDFSERMIEMLEQKLASGGELQGASIRPRLMDGQRLAFADDSFDFGLSMFGLMFFPDRGGGFRELLRVLKPGGRACVSSWLPISAVPVMQWAFGALGAITPPPPADAPPRQPILEDPDVFALEMSAAGFRSVRVLQCSEPMPIPSIEQFWEGMVRSSAPIALLRQKVGEDSWLELNQRALDHLHATAAGNLDDPKMEAWLAVGEKPA